ncbi:MAG: hypothetical protein AB1742_06465, partial [bacterium]
MKTSLERVMEMSPEQKAQILKILEEFSEEKLDLVLSALFRKYSNVFCAKRLGVRCVNTALTIGDEGGDGSPQSREA